MLLIQMNLGAFEGSARVFESGEMDLTSCLDVACTLKQVFQDGRFFAEFIRVSSEGTPENGAATAADHEVQ